MAKVNYQYEKRQKEIQKKKKKEEKLKRKEIKKNTQQTEDAPIEALIQTPVQPSEQKETPPT